MPQLEAVHRGLDRRAFLKSLGGGALVLFVAGTDSDAQESGGAHRGYREQLPEDVAAWLHIAPNGSIIAFTGKVEVGQNIRSSLAQAVADELRCEANALRLVMGDTARTPWDAGTFGSRTTPTMAPVLRKMASTMREVLIDTAARGWNVDRNSLTISNECVFQKGSGKKAGFGELAARVDWVHTIGKDGLTTAPSDWHAAGISTPKVNVRDIVTGEHRYSTDHKLPEMLYGAVLRAPSFAAKLTSADTGQAAKMDGATVVREGDFVGVAARDEHIAAKALQSIQAKWDQQPQISQSELFSYIKQNTESSRPGRGARATGSVEAGLRSAVKTLRNTYTVAYIAHTPLEPRAAVAEWNGNNLTVWTGTQRPFGVRTELAGVFSIPEENVRVIVPDTGSAYGGKHTGECAVEAARLAKHAGKPVKLIWTREEEFTWAYFRPAGVIDVSSGVSSDGMLTAWEFHNYLSGPSGIDTPYEVANRTIEFHEAKSPLREGSYRGLASTANHFARESHMDELAITVGLDPLAFRLKNLKNDRVRAVLEAAAKRFGWPDNRRTSTTGYGLACGTDKGGYVGCCAEVRIHPDRTVQVTRVVEAWECGAVVNPEHLKNQVEGAIVMGLGGALFEAIDFANGRILNAHLAKYRVPRFNDVPTIEVVLLDRKDLPSAGAGEIPIVGIAPAVGNAIFNATGVRVRSMPILPAFVAQVASA
ncbi:MAG TPA: molybdopterin cofactor-binding domain-containing protein [Bryobacteraceae bacterium]|jgi:isoquinoline 1-oxidoreductase|nr:molybdopterin cofactor-binding domain-containing protein [Bryobacteraceae bacterium]